MSACYEGIDYDDDYADLGADLGAEDFGDETAGSGGETGSEQTGGDGDGDSDPTTTGDGDGDPTTTGDGDGDPTTTGDGDGDPTTTGDGDGDPTTTGDGDGDPDPTTGDGDGDPDPTTTTGGDGDGDSDLPNNAYCDPVANWSASWDDLERQVIVLVNEARAQGGNCGAQGNFPASGPLTWHPALTCAARVHSLDMGENNYFSHTNLQNNGPGWRLDQAGYNGGGWGENIAAGYGNPQQVVQGWLDSDGHCANMLNPNFSRIGVGYADVNGSTYGDYWTQNFGN